MDQISTLNLIPPVNVGIGSYFIIWSDIGDRYEIDWYLFCKISKVRRKTTRSFSAILKLCSRQNSKQGSSRENWEVKMQSFCRSFAVGWKSKDSPFVVPPLYSQEDPDFKTTTYVFQLWGNSKKLEAKMKSKSSHESVINFISTSFWLPMQSKIYKIKHLQSNCCLTTNEVKCITEWM